MPRKSPATGELFAELAEQTPPVAGAHQAAALKRTIAWELEHAMKARGLTKTDLARLMDTSRAQVDRLLDPENDGLTLETLARAAAALGLALRIELA